MNTVLSLFSHINKYISNTHFSSALILILTLLYISPYSFADHSKQGPAFSDHNYIQTMPNTWQKKSISYKKIPDNVDLVITLDQHLYPALKPLIKKYAQLHKLRIVVQDGTCGISAGALLDKKVDIGGFCCPAGKTDRLPDLTYHTLGIASIALIVHPENPVNNITYNQAQDIYRGKIGNWSKLNSEFKQPIYPLARLHCKNRPGHWRLILDNEDMFSPAIHEVGTIPDIVRSTSNKINSLGYETLWMKHLHAGNKGVKTLSIDGIGPEDNGALIAARYPLYRTYNVTTWKAPHLHKPHAEQLVKYFYQNFNDIDAIYGLVSSAQLRKAGWKFSDNELIAPPEKPIKREIHEHH